MKRNKYKHIMKNENEKLEKIKQNAKEQQTVLFKKQKYNKSEKCKIQKTKKTIDAARKTPKHGTQNNPHSDAEQNAPKHGTQNNPHHDADSKKQKTEKTKNATNTTINTKNDKNTKKKTK